jgi:hypothetical protein
LSLPISPVLTAEEVTLIIAILNKYWFGSFEKYNGHSYLKLVAFLSIILK